MFLLLGFSVGYTGSNLPPKSETTTTVILIRHAERDNFFNITAQGLERAKALIDTVSDMGITAIYSPDLERNLDTVRPLARHLGIDITLTPRIAKPTIDKIVREILENHFAQRGKMAVCSSSLDSEKLIDLRCGFDLFLNFFNGADL